MAFVRVLQNFGFNYPYNARIPVISPSGNTGQYRLVSANMVNRSGSNSDVGIFRQFGAQYNIYTTHAGVATSITSSVSGSSIFTTTNGDGFAVGSAQLFNLVGFLLSQAQGGSPVYTYKYWNGSTWATLNTITVPASYGTASEDLIIFGSPPDWAIGSGGSLTGIASNEYAIWVQASTAGSQAVKSSSAWVAQMIDFAPQISGNDVFEWKVATTDIALVFNGGDTLLPYFSSSSTSNLVTGQYWIVD